MEREVSRSHAAASRESHRTQFNLSVIYFFLAAERDAFHLGKSEQPGPAKNCIPIKLLPMFIKIHALVCLPYSYCNRASFSTFALHLIFS